VATQSEIDSYRTVIDGLSTVAFAQVKALLQSLDTQNPIEFRNALLLTYPEILSPFLTASGDVAATWYAELRSSAGLRGAVPTFVSARPPQVQLDAAVRYSLTPLFKPATEQSEFIGSGILSLLAGSAQKLIANRGRDTVTGLALADSGRVGYARIPRSDACAFCGLMASRGAIYRSEASAGGVVGRGVSAQSTAGKRGGQGRGTKIRGVQSLGSSFHDLCRCVVAPRFSGADNDYMDYTAKTFTDLYTTTGGIVDGRTDFKATLASWREEHGTK